MADERHGHMRSIGAMLPRVAGPALGKRGLGDAQLIQNWAAIVGERLARSTCPEKISYAYGERRDGTLRLSVATGIALEIQHNEPVILERINAFFGYRAVVRLSIHQTLERRRKANERPPKAPDIDVAVPGIDDAELRAALKRLGSAVASQHRK